MDPQQRMLLECVYTALESSGITMHAAKGSQTGVVSSIKPVAPFLPILTVDHLWASCDIPERNKSFHLEIQC